MHQLRAGCWGSTAVHSQLLWPIVWSREENFLRQWEALHRLGNSRHASQGERISPITVVHDASYMEEHGICLEEAQISQAGEVGFGWVVFPSEPISMCTLDHDLQLINFLQSPSLRDSDKTVRSLPARSAPQCVFWPLAAWMAVLIRTSVPRWYGLLVAC